MIVRCHILCIALLFLPVSLLLAQPAFWRQTSGPYGGEVISFASCRSGFILAGTAAGFVSRSTDEGATWRDMSTGLTRGQISTILVTSKGSIFVGKTNWDGGLFRFIENYQRWVDISEKIPSYGQTFFKGVDVLWMNSRGHIFVFLPNYGLYRSTDDGETWQNSDGGLPSDSYRVSSFAENSNGHLFMGVDYYKMGLTVKGVFRSTDDGDTWTLTSLANTGFNSFQISSITADQQGAILAGTTNDGLFRSSDDGVTWVQQTSPSNTIIGMMLDSKGRVLASTAAGLFYVTDGGATWTRFYPALAYQPTALAESPGGRLVAGTRGNGVYVTQGIGSPWSQGALCNSTPSSLLIIPSGDLLAGTPYGLYRSTDAGNNWVATTLKPMSVPALTRGVGGAVFAGADSGLYRTSDDGVSWTRMGFPSARVSPVALDSRGNIFAGNFYRSTNDGQSWTQLQVGYDRGNAVISAVTVDPAGFVFVGTGGKYGGEIYRSADGGESWLNISQGGVGGMGVRVTSIVVGPEGLVYVSGDEAGVFVSADKGMTWTKTRISWRTNMLLCDSLGHVFAATEGSLFVTVNEGKTWMDISYSLVGTPFCSLAMTPQGHLFVGTSGRGIYESIPKLFLPTAEGNLATILFQNYPNPFNSETIIEFALPSDRHVTLVVYNALGQEVTKLVDGDLTIGQHQAKWNASGNASGVYYYRMRLGDFTEVKKLLLLR